MADVRYILLDQGAFRSSELSDRIASDASAHFVVPDIAFSEMVIKRDPIQTIMRSLRALKPAADRAYVSISCGEIKALRQSRPKLALSDLLTPQGTEILRVLLEGEASADYAAVVARILETAPSHKAIYDGRQDKAAMLDHVAIFSRKFGAHALRFLRAGKFDEREKLGIILMIMTTIQSHFETEVDMRYLLVRLARIMMWAEKLGLENISDEKVLNDAIDMDFVVAGSYFDEVMTRDKTVAALDRILRKAMDKDYSTGAVAAAFAIGFKVAV